MAINRWTDAETKRALYLYFQLPFGQLHSRNPEIIALAAGVNRTPSSVAMKLANFASLDPKITQTGRKGLDGASTRDRQIWADFHDDWTKLVMDAAALENAVPSGGRAVREKQSAFIPREFIGATTVPALVQQRVGQDFFRRAVLANYDGKCCLTGIAEMRLLNASHILPWGKDEKNRHNPRNGLCLSATFDRAFDRGLMGVDEAGRALFSAKLLKNESADTRAFFEPYHEKRLLEPVRFDPDPGFLKWHHDHCFERV